MKSGWRLIILISAIYFVITCYFLYGKSTSENYSFTQKYQEYYGLNDWNLPLNAYPDIDQDSHKDLFTYTNCVFISSLPAENILPTNQCDEPYMASVVFADGSIERGQHLTAVKPYKYQGLSKTYLVKTQSGIWKLYDLNGFQLRTYEMGTNLLFSEVPPTLLDKIDMFTYQSSHLGVHLILNVMK